MILIFIFGTKFTNLFFMTAATSSAFLLLQYECSVKPSRQTNTRLWQAWNKEGSLWQAEHLTKEMKRDTEEDQIIINLTTNLNTIQFNDHFRLVTALVCGQSPAEYSRPVYVRFWSYSSKNLLNMGNICSNVYSILQYCSSCKSILGTKICLIQQ